MRVEENAKRYREACLHNFYIAFMGPARLFEKKPVGHRGRADEACTKILPFIIFFTAPCASRDDVNGIPAYLFGRAAASRGFLNNRNCFGISTLYLLCMLTFWRFGHLPEELHHETTAGDATGSSSVSYAHTWTPLWWTAASVASTWVYIHIHMQMRVTR